MTEPAGYGWFALVGVGGLVVAAISLERWWRERCRNREVAQALRAYLRDSADVRDDRDRRCVEHRRRFIATLAELPLGELAPEWAVEPQVEVPTVEEERAPLKVVRGAGR